jgi:hypothetical protein
MVLRVRLLRWLHRHSGPSATKVKRAGETPALRNCDRAVPIDLGLSRFCRALKSPCTKITLPRC